MDCSYCFYLDKQELYRADAQKPTPAHQMSAEVLENFIRQYIEQSLQREVHFIWQGGEPTLYGLDKFRTIVELQERYRGNKRISNTLQTNASLIDQDWIDFLNTHQFKVGVSIDGPPEMNDPYRTNFKRGTNLESKIKALQAAEIEMVSLSCIHQLNWQHPLEVYAYLKALGFHHQQYIPITPGTMGRPEALERGNYATFLNQIFDQWVKTDVGQIFVQPFDLALEAWSGVQSHLCVFNKTCGTIPILEKNGDVYACDHFVDENYLLGNIQDSSLMTMVTSAEQESFANHKFQSLHPDCHTCPYLFACYGGCPKDRTLPVGNHKQNFLCSDYLSFFNHIDPYMTYMKNELANRRPPATVMSWAPE